MCSTCMAKNDWSGTFHLGQGVGTAQYAGLATQGSTGDALVDGLISGAKWNATALTYSFPQAVGQFTPHYTSAELLRAIDGVVSPLTAAMETAARAAFAEMSSYTNLAFTELAPSTSITSVDITLMRTDDTTTAFAYSPGNRVNAGDAWFGLDASIASPVRGQYGWITMLHELGHSMGLKHSHEAGGIAGAVTPLRDAMEFSLMSYRSYVGASLGGAYTNETSSYAQTFMMLDIAALQAMYGADYSTNSGDSVYTFNASTGQMSINGSGDPAPGANRIFRTVWDGGGVDTYDYSNYSNNQDISLAAGRWSMFSQVQRADLGGGNEALGNVYNALLVGGDTRALIENANAGSGNDKVEGNQAANILNGNAGNDTVHGQGGDDTINGGIGADMLYGDFLPTTQAPVAPPPTYTIGSGYLTTSAASYISIASALNVMSNFSFAADPEINNATSIAHTTVNVTASGANANYYAVTLNAGNRVIADIDNTVTAGYDSWVRLLDSSGQLLQENDDAGLDAGSTNDSGDSMLSFTAQAAGTYYLVVGSYGSNSTFAPNFYNSASSSVNPATQYELNISIENSATFADATGNLGVAGNDILNGGAGDDILIGGAGSDTAVFEYSGDLPAGQGVVWGGSASNFRYRFGTEGTDTLTEMETVRLVQSGGTTTNHAVADLTRYFSSEALGINAYGTSGAAGGWADNDLYTRRIGDVNGDNRADVIAFGSDFTYVSLGQANGTFAGPIIGINSFGSGAAGGSWVSDNVYKRQIADVNGDNFDDIVGFGSAYTYVSLGQADGTFAATIIGINSFGASVPAGGWTNNNLYARELADVNGDGRADIVGFGSDHTFVALGQANGTFANPFIAISGFGASAAGGSWTSQNQLPRFVGDVSGDGRADIVGFGRAGVFVSLGQANGTFGAATLTTAQFSMNSGWASQTALPRAIGDLNNDGRMDLIGFGYDGTYGALALPGGTGFTQAALMTSSFGRGAIDGLWDSNNINPRMVGDVDNDGRADLIGFGTDGARIAVNATDFFVI
jgi:Ca2+-binding RTX toxin-like protein